MARCCSVSVFLVVVLLVTSSLAASTKRRQATRRKAPAKPIVQHYYPPIHGPYRTSGSPAKSTSGKPNTSTRQIQQWQIAVNVPPGSSLPPQGNAPPSPAAPGHIWIQVPVAGYPQPPAANPVPVSQIPDEPAIHEIEPEQPAPEEPAPEQPAAPAEPAPEQPQEPAGEEETSGNEIESAPAQPPAAGDIGTDPEKLKHCLEPRGQFPSPTECNKFYNCWDGYVAEQSCPGELVFSDQGPFCDYVENVDCSQRGGVPPPPPPPASQPPQEEEEQGAEEGSEGGFAPGNENGSEQGGEQEGGEEQVEEGEEAEEEQISEEELAEDIGEGCKEPYSRYRSPKNCDVFIVCDNGNPIRFKCPATLNYNENLGVCDYAYRVDCGASAPAQSPESAAPSEGEEAAPAPQVPEEVLRYYGGFSKMPPIPVGYGQRKRHRQG